MSENKKLSRIKPNQTYRKCSFCKYGEKPIIISQIYCKKRKNYTWNDNDAINCKYFKQRYINVRK